MAYDKVIDSAKLDGAITATADAIRAKTGSASKIPWDETNGFASAITTQNKSVTPTASSQTIKPDTGYIGLGQVTINGDSDLKAANIAKGVNIFGVTGTFESAKVATGMVTTRGTGASVTVSGLGFKPTKIIVYLPGVSINMISSSEVENGYFDNRTLYLTYESNATTAIRSSYDYYTDDEDVDYYYTDVGAYSNAGTITPTSDGFTVKCDAGSYEYIAIG